MNSQSHTKNTQENQLKSQLIKSTTSAEIINTTKKEKEVEHSGVNISNEVFNASNHVGAYVRTIAPVPVRTNRTCSVLLTGPPGSGLLHLAAGIAKKVVNRINLIIRNKVI